MGGGAYAAAVRYCATVVVLAAIAFAVYAYGDRASVYSATLVPLVLFGGGAGALYRAHREWKAGDGWVVWQGAGWFLLLLMLVTLTVPGSAIMAGCVDC